MSDDSVSEGRNRRRGPRGNRSRVTIRDVAEAANVSVTTVSRVFTHPHLFREETRARVQAAAEELKYTPNRNAAALITGRTGNIGLVVPNLANPVFPEMVKAAQHAAQQEGWAFLLADSDDSPERELQLIKTLSKQVDGMLALSSMLNDADVEFVASLSPTVFVNRDVPGHRSVLVDAKVGMSFLAHYFASLGHESIGYLPGPAGSWVSRHNREALERASNEAGLGLTIYDNGPATFEVGSDLAEELVRRPLPTAVSCFNDMMALGLTSRLVELGIDVPGQISVAGWGGTMIGRYATPGLTTVATPFADLGSLAVRELHRAQEDPDERPAGAILIQPTLEVRGTTARARIT